MSDFKKILSAGVAISLLACLTVGCAAEDDADPTTQTPQTTAPVETTASTETTAPTSPDHTDEAQVEHSHYGLRFKLGESFTTEVSEANSQLLQFHSGDIKGSVEYGSMETVLGRTVSTSQEAANHLLSQMPDAKDAWIGSSTGVCFYLVVPGTETLQVYGVYVYGDMCWKVMAESPDSADKDLLIRIVGRGSFASVQG